MGFTFLLGSSSRCACAVNNLYNLWGLPSMSREEYGLEKLVGCCGASGQTWPGEDSGAHQLHDLG